MRLRTSLVLVSILAAVACGGKSKPPAASGGPATGDSGAESIGAVSPSDGAEVDGGDGKTASGGVSAPLTPAPPAPPEVKDECTPVGVDFEKRARPKLKDCYAAGKKKDPALEGTVKIAVTIDSLGKVKGIKVAEKTLPEPVAQCMLKVVKATPLPEASKCPGRTLTIPVTFPTPH